MPFVGNAVMGDAPGPLERGALMRARSDLDCEPDDLVVVQIGGGGTASRAAAASSPTRA
jgi:hypothetical protein